MNKAVSTALRAYRLMCVIVIMLMAPGETERDKTIKKRSEHNTIILEEVILKLSP